jgi:ElaB/YqjD/DUF883 family membrane-anchored ribosome-binding protein
MAQSNNEQATIDQGADKLRGAFNEAEKKIKQGQEQIARLASDIDKQARENPWPLVAGVSVVCFLVGIIIGKSRE